MCVRERERGHWGSRDVRVGALLGKGNGERCSALCRDLFM